MREKRSSTYSMFPELFDHAQAEDVGYLCVHRETGGQDVSILIHTDTARQRNRWRLQFILHWIKNILEHLSVFPIECNFKLALYCPLEACLLHSCRLWLGKFPTRKEKNAKLNSRKSVLLFYRVNCLQIPLSRMRGTDFRLHASCRNSVLSVS